MSKIRYTKKIQREIISKYSKGYSIDDLCKKYLISKSTIYRWIKDQKNNIELPSEKIIEYKRVVMENNKLKNEIDILKRAIEILSIKD